jgi:exonuclease III
MDRRYPHRPYQMDYLYASPALAKRLESCKAIPHDVVRTPSDHYPIVAVFRCDR